MEKFASTFIGINFAIVDVALLTTSFQQVGSYTIPAGEELSIGSGVYDDQERATGRIYANPCTAADTIMPGTMRLVAQNPQGRTLKVLYEGRTERLASSTTRNQMQPLPKSPYVLTEDQKLVMEFKPDTAGTLDISESSFIIDVTKYLV